MKDSVIEPSEIITGRDDTVYAHRMRANPWLRFIARLFDYALFFNLFHWFIHPVIVWPSFVRFVPLEFFAWIPVETLLLWTWGTTPGKWLLSTEIKKGYKKRLPFTCALRRSLLVWFRGLGVGIFLLNVFCMLSAYYRLTMFQITSWDRDEHTVILHNPLAKWRFYVTLALAIAGMTYYHYHGS